MCAGGENGLRTCSEPSGSVADNNFQTNVRSKMCASCVANGLWLGAFGLRFMVTECELGFSYYNLNCLCSLDSFRVFYILERAALRIVSAKLFARFCPACDMFLNLFVCITAYDRG